MKKHKAGCMVCGEELVYSSQYEEVKCIYCRDLYKSNVSCSQGHYICDICHSKDSMDLIYSYFLNTEESWGLANEMTGHALIIMGKNGGPR